MSLRGSLFSLYQQKLKGMITREYSRGHVVYEQMKIDSVNSNKNNFIGVRKKRIVEKHLKQFAKNINFYCQMINQQILEKAS